MAELTHGELDNALDVEKLYKHYPAYAGGYMFLRYIAKQFSDYAIDNDFSDESVTYENYLPDGLSKSGVLIKATKTFKGKSIIMADYTGVKNLDATVLSGAIKITGNNADNSIKSGKGADKIFGGAGNDAIYGGDGNDTFVYTANTGTDIIFDYSNGDMLQILDAKGSKVSFSKAAFSNNDLTLSVKGGGTIIFDDVSSSTSFNINGTNYKISGSKLVKK